MNQTAGVAVRRPSLALLGAAPFRAALEFALRKLGPSDTLPRGDGHPVVIFPGLGADGASVTTLREHCRALGYEAFDWGRGSTPGRRANSMAGSKGWRARSRPSSRAARSRRR